MQITETRKAIIELIEPYMYENKSKYNSDIRIVYTGGYGDDIIKEYIYDLSSLIKFISKKYSCDEIKDNEIWFNDYGFAINLKPLHLYTEEEDKNLLELLKELCIKKN